MGLWKFFLKNKKFLKFNFRNIWSFLELVFLFFKLAIFFRVSVSWNIKNFFGVSVYLNIRNSFLLKNIRNFHFLKYKEYSALLVCIFLRSAIIKWWRKIELIEAFFFVTKITRKKQTGSAWNFGASFFCFPSYLRIF